MAQVFGRCGVQHAVHPATQAVLVDVFGGNELAGDERARRLSLGRIAQPLDGHDRVVQVADYVLQPSECFDVLGGRLSDDGAGGFDGVAGAFGLNADPVQIGVGGSLADGGDREVEASYLTACGVANERPGGRVGARVGIEQWHL